MNTAPNPQNSAVHRYFEVSLFLLLTVGFLALATTGRAGFPWRGSRTLASAPRRGRFSLASAASLTKRAVRLARLRLVA